MGLASFRIADNSSTILFFVTLERIYSAHSWLWEMYQEVIK